MGCCASSPQVKSSKSTGIRGRVGGAVSSTGDENAFPRVSSSGAMGKETGHQTSASSAIKGSTDYPRATRSKAPGREDSLLLRQKTSVGPPQPPSRQMPPQMTTTNQRLDQNVELQRNVAYRGPPENPHVFIHHQQPSDATRLAYGTHHNGVYGNNMGCLRPLPIPDRQQFSNFVVAQQPHIQMGFRNVLGGTDFMHAPCAYPRRGLGEVASWYPRTRPSAVDDGRLVTMRGDADSQQGRGQFKTKETSKKKGKGRGGIGADGNGKRRKSSQAIHHVSDESPQQTSSAAPEVPSASAMIPPLPLSDRRQDVGRNETTMTPTHTSPPTTTKRLSVANTDDGTVSSATPKPLDKIDSNNTNNNNRSDNNGNDVLLEAADLGDNESFDECHSIVSSLGEQSLSCLSALDVDEEREEQANTIAHEVEGERVEGCATDSILLNQSAEETDTDGLSDSLRCADRAPQLMSETSDRNLPPVSVTDESDINSSSPSSEDGDAEGKLGSSEADLATEKIEEEFCYFYSDRGFDVEDGDTPVDGFPGWWRRKVEISDETQQREGRLSLFVGCLEGKLPPLSPYRSYRPTIPRSARHALILTADPLKDLGAYSVYRRRRSESFGPSTPRQGRREAMSLTMHELNRDAAGSKPKAQAYQSKARRRRTSGNSSSSGRVFG